MCLNKGMDDIELRKETTIQLAERRVEVAEATKTRCLAKSDPEAWMDVAGRLIQGQSRTMIRKRTGRDYHVISRVLAELEGMENVEDLKKQWAVDNATVVHLARSIEEEGLNRILEKGEELDAKDLHYINKIKTNAEFAHQRLRGEADVVHKHEGLTLEDAKQAGLEALKRIEEAKVIDLEDES